MNAKQKLRETLRLMRKSLTVAMKTTANQAICDAIIALSCYKTADHIALYAALPEEVNLDSVWYHAIKAGKQCYFPIITADNRLLFSPITPDSAVVKNRYGIEEPDVPFEHCIHPDALNLVFFPVLGFDALGHRLGMGGGYYDRTFKDSSTLKIGVAYGLQQRDHIPIDAWDVTLDGVITERGHFGPLFSAKK